jgi:hypothetical protein
MTDNHVSSLLHDGQVFEGAVEIHGERILLSREALERSTGWTLNDAGLCRRERCVPVRDPAALSANGQVDLTAVAGLLDMPLVVDMEQSVVALGESAAERNRALKSHEAPDFTLPDLDGTLRSLTEFRGRKVLLLAFSSW